MGRVTSRYRVDLPNDDWFIGETPDGYDFIVARRGAFDTFRPNIGATTIPVAAGTALSTVMEQSAHATREKSHNFRVTDGPDDAGRQTLSFSVAASFGELELTQHQAFYAVAGDEGEDRVLCVVMSAASRDAGELVGDFNAFLGSLRFDDA